jgi:hypothetical protein
MQDARANKANRLGSAENMNANHASSGKLAPTKSTTAAADANNKNFRNSANPATSSGGASRPVEGTANMKLPAGTPPGPGPARPAQPGSSTVDNNNNNVNNNKNNASQGWFGGMFGSGGNKQAAPQQQPAKGGKGIQQPRENEIRHPLGADKDMGNRNNKTQASLPSKSQTNNSIAAMGPNSPV